MSVGITCTGADERTDLERLSAMRCEVGILVRWESPFKRGHAQRYPCLEWIKDAMDALPNVALHFCGLEAKSALFHSNIYDGIVSKAQRIQINGDVNLEYVAQECEMYPEKKWITQWREDTISSVMFLTHSNHQLLVDSSGGRGILPGEWKRPCTFKRVGYAGGLNAPQLKSEFSRIAEIAGDDFWIDAEHWLREDNWFNLDHVERFIDVFMKSCETHGLKWE